MGRMNRSIVRLIPLEVSAQSKDSIGNNGKKLNCEDKNASGTQVEISKEVTESRLTRNSARKAQQKVGTVS